MKNMDKTPALLMFTCERGRGVREQTEGKQCIISDSGKPHEENKTGQCDLEWGFLAVLDKVAREGLSEEVTVGPKLEFGPGARQAKFSEQSEGPVGPCGLP